MNCKLQNLYDRVLYFKSSNVRDSFIRISDYLKFLSKKAAYLF